MSENIKQLQDEVEKLKFEKDELSNKLENLKTDKMHLSNTIVSERISVKSIEKTISSLNDTLFSLNETIENHEYEKSNITDELKHMDKKLSKIEQQFLDKKKQLDALLNEEICKKSLKINDENSYCASIKKNTSTTPIITKYCKSDKEFMLLNARMKLSKYKSFSYIVIRSNKTIVETQKNVPTMSELKSVADKSIFDVTIPRVQYLKEHIISAVNKYENLTQGLIIPFSEPCSIGGQSDFNQTGYGWEWDWSYGVGDYIEGTYYGEMTGFFVIGIKINEATDYWL